VSRKCKTPGTTFSIAVHAGGSGIGLMINLPHPIRADQKTIRTIKRRLHDAIESVLAETFKFNGYSQLCVGDRRTPPAMILCKDPPHLLAAKKAESEAKDAEIAALREALLLTRAWIVPIQNRETSIERRETLRNIDAALEMSGGVK
jgi:hypothetical protein